MTNSTRRVRCRPSGSSEPSALLLGATGLVSPKPRALSRAPLRQRQIVAVVAFGVGMAVDVHRISAGFLNQLGDFRQNRLGVGPDLGPVKIEQDIAGQGDQDAVRRIGGLQLGLALSLKGSANLN